MIDPFSASHSNPRPDPAYKTWTDAGRRAMMRHDLNARTAGPMPSFGNMVRHTNPALAPSASSYAPQSIGNADAGKPDIEYANGNDSANGDDFSFGDVIDMINPLHHLPVIGMVYRKLTGDEIKPFSSIIGGAIFGGPVGAVGSTVNAVVKVRTGRDVAENAFAMAGFDIAPAPPEKPDLEYLEPAAQNMAETTHKNAIMQYERTSSGSRNFSSAHKTVYSWNA